MDTTQRLRHAILALGNKEFSFRDFSGNGIGGILLKMEKRGEVIFVRHQSTKGRPEKIYVVGKLIFKSITKKREAEQKRTFDTWSDVYPEFFKPPEFNILNTTLHELRD